VLANFGKTRKRARNEYLSFVRTGASQVCRPGLIGGGLIRSLGGWKEIKKVRLNKQDSINGDKRILGDSDFVMEVLAKGNERFDRRYSLKGLGYYISRLERKVIELFDIEKEELYSGSRKKPISKARDLFCYWCVRELGESMRGMAKLLGLTQSVDRGRLIA